MLPSSFLVREATPFCQLHHANKSGVTIRSACTADITMCTAMVSLIPSRDVSSDTAPRR